MKTTACSGFSKFPERTSPTRICCPATSASTWKAPPPTCGCSSMNGSSRTRTSGRITTRGSPPMCSPRASCPSRKGPTCAWSMARLPGCCPRSAAAAGEKNIWVLGGGELLGQFLDIDAIDTLALTIAPAALAGGAQLLPRNIGGDRLELAEARPAGPFARLVYRVRRAS
ncbi:dihydrofolate reductase family protein [Glutamicibacter halophytocola]|uniref:dihydrofolate reductase family protein n=1 Tax=Glutamicibacter halophytocola TaxID=1933880 RepID=UPI00321B1588